MGLSPAERRFVARRERLTGSWPLVGALLLVLLFVLLGWLWAEVPYLVDPWAVSAGLREGTLPGSTVDLMVAILPVVVLMLLVLACAVVLLAFAAFSNERRLIRLVRKLEPSGTADAPRGQGQV